MNECSGAALKTLIRMQQNEIDEYHIYQKIAEAVKSEKDRDILLQIAQEEASHGKLWGKYTGLQPKPNKGKVFWYSLLAKIFGYTFALKLMENGEDKADKAYTRLIQEIPEAEKIAEDEERHEQALLVMLDEERLQFVGSMVLGMNDALVELTGTLAGLTFALQDNLCPV